MTERRNTDRIVLPKMMVREMNGDYIYSFRAHNLCEEGIFLESRMLGAHEPFSKLSFTLPNGKHIKNVTAKIVREDRKGHRKGAAYEFLKIAEQDRIELKKFFNTHLLKGSA